MSHTDKDAPEWVRALHAARDGRHTVVAHSRYCRDYPGPRPRYHVVRRMTRAEAEANGWPPAERWSEFGGRDHVYAEVPHGPFECDLDTPGSRCGRWVSDRDRWYAFDPPSRRELHTGWFGPERAAVRDSLRAAAREYNTHGEVDTEPPVRQTRSSTWVGGWWD